jgi:hypothetical protein
MDAALNGCIIKRIIGRLLSSDLRGIEIIVSKSSLVILLAVSILHLHTMEIPQSLQERKGLSRI